MESEKTSKKAIWRRKLEGQGGVFQSAARVCIGGRSVDRAIRKIGSRS